MSKIIAAQSIAIIARQKIEVPVFTKFITANLDIRHNNCLLWMLAEDENDAKKENVEIIMIKLNDSLEPPNAKYVASIKDNSGHWHVFALRDSERLFGTGTTVK